MINIVKIIILFLGINFVYNVHAIDTDSLEIKVNAEQQNDGLHCSIITNNPKHQLSLLMQGLQLYIIGNSDTIHARFPDAMMVRHKVKRHPNEVKPMFRKNNEGEEVRPDLQPLIKALADTVAYIDVSGETIQTRDFGITLNKRSKSMCFDICIPDTSLADETVKINVVCKPQKYDNKEFRGKRLSKEKRRNPAGLGEAPSSQNDKNRMIDYTVSKVIKHK